MTRPIHVLVVEDSKEDAELCLHELRRAGFDPTFQRVEDAEDFLGALRATAWDVILCDYTMPQFDAMTALRLLRESARQMPFIETWTLSRRKNLNESSDRQTSPI